MVRDGRGGPLFAELRVVVGGIGNDDGVGRLGDIGVAVVGQANAFVAEVGEELVVGEAVALCMGSFRVVLVDGREIPDVWGKVSPPFAFYQGSPHGPAKIEPRTLVYLRTGAIIATLKTARQCKALAAELAPAYSRDEASAAGIIERHQRESA